MRLYLLMLLAMLGGCQSMNVESPQTINERLYFAQAGLTAATNTVADLRQAGIIKEAEMPKVRQMIDDAYAALRAGRLAIAAGKPTDALTYLQTAQTILVQLRAYLRATAQAKEEITA